MRKPTIIWILSMCCACGPGRANSEDGDAAETTTTGTTESETGQNSDPSESGPSDTSTEDESGLPHQDFHPDDFPCDPFAQDCPVGEKCVPWSPSGNVWDANKCVPVMGDQAMGEQCTYGGVLEATDDCDADSFCFDTEEVNGEQIGTCHAFCTGTPRMPECPEAQQCILTSGPVTLCFPTCDPTVQDCGDGEGCYWSGTVFTCVPPMGDGLPPGEPCEFANECEVGSICLDVAVAPDCGGNVGCCGSFCDIGLGDMQCAAVPGTSCVAFWEQGMAPEGYEHVGICIISP